MTGRSVQRWAALSFLAVVVQACGDSSSPPQPTTVQVSPPTSTMTALGETSQYSARLLDKKGNEIPDAAFTWSTSDGQVASVTATGLVTGLRTGAVSIRASSEGITGSASLTIDPVPTEVLKVAGDGQEGILRQVLPGRPTVEVLDANENPISGKFVTFSVVAGGGTVTPRQVQTGADGRASTTWTLGCSNENPQLLNATVGGISVTFSTLVDLEALAICQDDVPDGRETLPYAATIEAAGGAQGSLSWTVLGDVPPGLTLHSDGVLSGTPTQAGEFQFTAQVQDGGGGSATALFGMRICDAPLNLNPGESAAFSPADLSQCGFFLPAGSDGSRYRLGVVYARSGADTIGLSTDVPAVTVRMTREMGGLVASEDLLSPVARANAHSIQAQKLPAELDKLLEIEEANQRAHYRLRQAEMDLLETLGPRARPLPDTRREAARRVFGPSTTSPEKMTFTNPDSAYNNCTVDETVTGIKIRENDLMVVYQDSTQWSSTPLQGTLAQAMLDYYQDYGKEVIDAYFGGTTDINDDGKIVVFVTPEVEEFGGAVAFVWSGDFFPKSTQNGWQGCPASNEKEMMRFSLSYIQLIQNTQSPHYGALGTTVHEVKHVSSLYNSIIRGGGLQPLWIEEGTAEIAKEMSSRLAWAGSGGPGVGAMATASFVNAFTEENFGVITPLAGTVRYLSSQPNGVVVTPAGASEEHSVYGSGWHFHRWLGDAYGTPGVAQGDAVLFRTLNDSLTAAAVPGILEVTGASSWAALMEEYLRAILLNGMAVPQGSRAFTTYDFPSITGIFSVPNPDGDYPWAVNRNGETNTAPFATDLDIGPVGPSGVRILDVTSDGTGLGLEVKVSTTGGQGPFRIVLVRVN